jgi:hypothetical protein
LSVGETVNAGMPVAFLGDMIYKATVILDESNPRFFWNMTATVTIETGVE